MGLFTKKGTCSICNKEQTKNKLADGYICKSCFKGNTQVLLRKPIRPLRSITVAEITEMIKDNIENKKLIEEFNPSKKFTGIQFDTNKKQFMINQGIDKIFDYKEIVEFELLEDGETVTKGGLGRAITGAALFGGVGAVVGGVTAKRKTKSIVTSLKIKITLNDIQYPNTYISLIKTKVKTDSFLYKSMYKEAQDILSILAIIVKENENITNNIVENKTSDVDEILKFKKLLDDGIITEDEFNKKKKLILGI